MLPTKKQQRQVWQRVYGGPKPRPQDPALYACRRRAGENLRFYESRGSDPVYGPAYQHLAAQTRREMAMLDSMAGKP